MVLRLGEIAAARFPHRTIVVSRTLQEHYWQRHGAKTIYIPNGTKLRAPAHSVPRREPYDYILYLGRFSPEKNCDLLIDAYDRIDTPVKLVLAGGSSYSDEYARGLHRRANHRIEVRRWVAGPELESLLVHALLFVLPSDIEGLSLALLDAMGAGVCVLASDIPENRELVAGAGFTFERGNVPDLERMLRFLLTHPESRARAAAGARERIRNHFLWPRVAIQIDEEYRNLAGEPRSRKMFSPWLPQAEQPPKKRAA
jgi:glycosyltransferase involved in cell wall biosynthesis